ncbi:MAG TPA: circadian clock KaiB family protein [Acidimicrobiales bacterium]|nr:circadian clock KaiB family protein [Acidimicrobiales bacterium]
MTARAEPDGIQSDDPMWRLRLYVAGQSPKCLNAFVNLRNLCEEHLAGRYEIEVVDLVEHPGLAQADNVLAVPTLVRNTPTPTRMLTGDLSDTARVLGQLGLEVTATS